ncbi:hypothetical protein BDW59DRAFT_179437 [Aspergillus cavernicola]|uniref:Nephrocystin 3-like N-terminal domain-containing protein n=1 Tax=Aspergillus cavernicola TaxID=176166 RepID=A0ABR4J1I2_9EURO
MLKKLCCSKSDRDDGPEQPARPIQPAPTAEANASSPSLVEKKPARRDLWKEAFESLGNDRTRYLPAEGESSAAAVDQVIEETSKKYEEWKNGGLKIRRRDGEDFNVRDSAQKILNSAMQFKEIITTVVSFDPTGHASSAWTIVSLGLTMVQNDISRRDAIFASSEFLAETLAYYTLVDAHHRHQKVDSDQNLDNVLLQVYTAVLDYTAEVNKVKQQNAGSRVLKSIIPIADQPIEQLKATVQEKGLLAEKWANLSNNLRIREDAAKTLDGIDETIARVKNVEAKTLSAEDERILKWVSTADYSKIQKETQGYRTPETGNWFLLSQHYKEWKACAGDILWLHGIVGCGKSVLCSTVIHDIERLCAENPSNSFAYWYFQFSNNATQSVESMVRSLIRQFSQKPLAPSVTQIWEQHGNRGSQPSRDTLAETLDDVISKARGELFLVLDALDECPDEPRRSERAALLSLLVGLSQRHKDKLHILATSRPERDIQSMLAKYPTVDLQARLAEDVETFVRAKVAEGILGYLDTQTEQRIIDGLLSTPERRFRWADLQIKRLAECLTDEQIEEALHTIPESLEETYRQVLDRVHEKQHDIVRSILILMCFSAVPLDTKTVAATASLRAPDLVVKICTTSLVTVNAEDMIKLAHFSVKEFLVIQNAESPHWSRFSAIKGHTVLARKTVDALLAQTEILTEERAMTQPLLVYAAKYWQTHVAALGDTCPPDLHSKINQLFTEENVYFNWVRIADSGAISYGSPWHKILKECQLPIHRAAQMGLTQAMDGLLAKGADPLVSFLGQDYDPLGRENTLTLAARYGHIDTAVFLLRKDIAFSKLSIQVLISVMDHRTAKHADVEAIISILWDKGLLFDGPETSKVISEGMVQALMNALLDCGDETSIPITESVLKCAIYNCRCPREMVELLFDRRNADIHITSSFFKFLGIENRLPQHPGGIDVIVRKRTAELSLDETTVAALARTVDCESMDLILRTHADIRVTDQILHAAASNLSGADMIRLLFHRREAGTEVREAILLIAAENDNGQDILKFLLEQLGPNASVGEEVLIAATESDNSLSKMEILLKKLGPGTQLSEDVTARLAASDLAMMRMVLDNQLASFAVCSLALRAAVAHDENPVEMLQLLINNGGSDVHITEEIVAEAAANSPHPAIMELLIELAGDSLPITEDVLVAAVKSDVKMIEILVQHVPDMRITDRVFLEACSNPKGLLVLLNQPHDHFPTEQIITTLGRRSGPRSGDVLKILLERQFVQANEELLETITGDDAALTVLLAYNPAIPVTEKALIYAAEDPSSIRLLLHNIQNTELITEEVMKAAARSSIGGASITSILDRVNSAPVTTKVLKEALCHGQPEVPELLLARSPDLDVQAVWDDIWEDPNLAWIVKMRPMDILPNISSLNLTESILPRYPYDFEQQKGQEYAFDDVIVYLCDYQTVKLTEDSAEIVIERCGNQAVERFLEYLPGLEITEELLKTAQRNPRADKDALLALLAARSTT